MWAKWLFDRVMSLVGLIVLSPVLLIVALLNRLKIPGGGDWCSLDERLIANRKQPNRKL